MSDVEYYLGRLANVLNRPNWKLFEPTEQFYACLLSGDEADLHAAASQITDHIGISPVAVSYEWSFVMPTFVAGRIHIRPGTHSKIEIPLFYVGKPLPLGAILAHELTHQLLAINGIWLHDEQQNEELTDAASIAAGLGKLVLNGTVTDFAADTGETQLLGYLLPRLRAELYGKVNARHNISEPTATAYLTERALHLLRNSRAAALSKE